MYWTRTVIVILVLILFSTSYLPLVRGVPDQVVYVSETNDYLHNPGDPVYLSIADGYVVIRVFTRRSINVVGGYVVINDTEYVLKPQLYLVDYIVWFTYTPYTGRPLQYFFKFTLGNGDTIAVYYSRDHRLFYFDGVNRYPQIEWVKYRVGYQIFPDRFYNGDPSNDHWALVYDSLNYDNTTNRKPVLSNWSDPPMDLLMHCCHQYYGGDIRGIIDKLDYLKDLGVGLIYLNPIYLAGSVHGYDPYDHYKLDPQFGTMDDLREFLDRAHQLGMKVIFDFVPDHVGLGHFAFQDVIRNGPRSRYWYWFTNTCACHPVLPSMS
jgi:cyclomaltodextrinase